MRAVVFDAPTTKHPTRARGRARMAESPRAQQASRRRQGQVNSAGLSESPWHSEADTAGVNPAHSPPLFECSQGTVLTLTPGNTARTIVDDVEDVDFMDGEGGGFNGDVGEEKRNEEDDEVLLPPLKSVFECGYVNLTPSGWECMWCGKTFVGRHSTRALCHVMKLKKNDVGVCSAAIPVKYPGGKRCNVWR